MRGRLIGYITRLWEIPAHKRSFFQKVLFLFLHFLEHIYCVLFYFSQNFRKIKRKKKAHYFYVISIGNLSVGGTGKTVFARFLVKNLGQQVCAVISRGYNRIDTGQKYILLNPRDSLGEKRNINALGDEPYMLAHDLGIPVVVGKNKSVCLTRLEDYSYSKPLDLSYVILDDAYQNHSIKKDCEILLIDGRSPLGNGHCLPAGPLREKDYQRADVIVITHADALTNYERENIREKFKNFSCDKIFYGKHVIKGIFHQNNTLIEHDLTITKKWGACAGIGSFGSFTDSLKSLNISYSFIKQYPDHYNYTHDDIYKIINSACDQKLDGIITTAKDWYKIKSVLEQTCNHAKLSLFYVLRVEFEFLSNQEYISFMQFLKREKKG